MLIVRHTTTSKDIPKNRPTLHTMIVRHPTAPQCTHRTPGYTHTRGLSAMVDAAYRQHAIDQGCARVREVEENVITPAMRRIESADPTRHLVGLPYRLKAKERLSEKV